MRKLIITGAIVSALIVVAGAVSYGTKVPIVGTVCKEITAQEYYETAESVLTKEDLKRLPKADDNAIFIKVTRTDKIQNIPVEYGGVYFLNDPNSKQDINKSMVVFCKDAKQTLLYNYEFILDSSFFNIEPNNDIFFTAGISIKKENRITGKICSIPYKKLSFRKKE